jgi:hypothetical protein
MHNSLMGVFFVLCQNEGDPLEKRYQREICFGGIVPLQVLLQVNITFATYFQAHQQKIGI